MEDKKILRDEKGRFLPGSVPNPSGRPKEGESLTVIISEYLSGIDEEHDVERKRVFAIKLYEKIKSGDVSAMRLALSYLDGLPVQVVKSEVKNDIRNISILNQFIEIYHPELKREYEEYIFGESGIDEDGD